MKSLGQNFLVNRGVLKKILTASKIEEGDVVVEIGPGHGELTNFILSAKPKKVFVLEKDHRLIPALKEIKALTVIEGDALVELPKLAKKIKGDYKLVGNIPYYITGHLFRTVGELTHKPTRATFITQKEVALRAVARPPEMNRLSASIQCWASPKVLGSIPARDFRPAPKVDSAIISLEIIEPRKKLDRYYEIMRAIFQQPRKTVVNNLLSGGIFKNRGLAIEALVSVGILPEARPQDIDVSDIEALVKVSKKE